MTTRPRLSSQVTEKGQVTIPKELRDALGIGAGIEVEFERRAGRVFLDYRHGKGHRPGGVTPARPLPPGVAASHMGEPVYVGMGLDMVGHMGTMAPEGGG